jgi:hypothetical protein
LIPLAVSVLERPWKHGIDDAYVDLDEVEKMLLLLADDQRLRVQLEVELTQDGRDGPILATESGAARGARLVQVMETGGRWTSAQRLEAEEILRDVVGRRNYLERHDVAQRRTKAGYVWRLTWVLLALIVLLAGSAALAATQRSNGADIILAVAAGAVGGAVSGLFRLRSSVERVRELKAAWPAIFIQPVIGAVGGLVVYGLFASGVVTISGLHLGDAQPSHWRAILILAFLGGFSERFFLKSLSRLGAAD